VVHSLRHKPMDQRSAPLICTTDASTEEVSVCIQVCQLSEEREALTLQLQIAKEQLVDVMQMLEGMEMAKGEYLKRLMCSMMDVV